MNLKSSKIYNSHSLHKIYLSYSLLAVLIFTLFFSFFPTPVNVARAALLSRAPDNLGLVGYWPMDENRGTTAGDSSGNGKNGTLFGATLPTWTDGKRGKSVYFNGTDNYVGIGNMGSFPTRGAVTFWMNAEVVENYRNPFTTSLNGSNVGIRFEEYTTPTPYGGFNVIIGNDSGTYSSHQYLSSTTLQPNTWYHVALVWDTSINTVTGYLNGVQKFSEAQIYWPTLMSSVAIGNGFSTSRYWKGKVDDVRLYNRALSAAEISKLYSGGVQTYKTVSQQGLVGYWAMNDGRGSLAGDSSGKGNNGTFNGNLTWVAGKRNGAINFNGASYITASSISLPRFTVSAWIKPNGNQVGAAGVISDMYPGYVNYTLAFDGGTTNIFGGTYNAGWYQTPRATLTSGQWAHVLTEFDGTYISLYINGAYVGQTAAPITPQSSGTQLRIGRRWDWADYFNGIIDEVRIYNRALSASEINGLYTLGAQTLNVGQNDKLTNGLVGLWSFNGPDINWATNTAFDRSGQSRNSTIFNTTPTQGKVGQALQFNGSTSYSSSTGFSELGTANQPYSFAGWVKINNGAGDGNIIHMASSVTGIGWCLPPVGYSGGKLRGYSWNGGGVSVTGTTTLQPNIWYHFVNTWDATNGLRIYVNGVLENSTAMAVYSASGGTNSLFLGFNPGGCAGNLGWLNGSLDEVRIYNRALSASEISQLYNMGK